MGSSDVYFYTASTLWVLWFLYMTGLFAWIMGTYIRIRISIDNISTWWLLKYDDICDFFAPGRPRLRAREIPPAMKERFAALAEIWSPSGRMPGVWITVAEDLPKDSEEKDNSVEVEGGFVLVEKET